MLQRLPYNMTIILFASKATIQYDGDIICYNMMVILYDTISPSYFMLACKPCIWHALAFLDIILTFISEYFLKYKETLKKIIIQYDIFHIVEVDVILYL